MGDFCLFLRFLGVGRYGVVGEVGVEDMRNGMFWKTYA